MYLDGSAVKKALSLPILLDKLGDVLQRYSTRDPSLQQPLRSILPVGDDQNCLLNLPCVDTDRGYLSVKTITSFPGSSPSVDGVVSLFDGHTGRLLLVADAQEITARRTAAASFLATRLLLLSKSVDKETPNLSLAIFGCGVQGRAHLDVFTNLFKWTKIYLWSRNSTSAIQLKSEFTSNIEIIEDLKDQRLRDVDVICTCTASEEALISLEQVKPGVHINAVGSFRENMRELADDLMLAPTTSVIVDSRESAMSEAGEIIQSKAQIAAELGELINNEELVGKLSIGKTTIFKSVGIAVEDLAAAIVLHESSQK